MNRKMALVAFAGVAAATAMAEAQTLTTLILNDGGFRYSEQGLTASTNRTGTGGGSSANFGFIGTNTSAGNSAVTSDYLFQNWWWYRSAGDTREFALSNQTFGTQLGANSAFMRYVEPIGGSSTNGTLTFEFTYTLNQISASQAAVTINWSIINNTDSAQPVNFFAYGDSDVLSASGNDGSYNTNPGVNFYRNNASTSNNTQFFTMGADLRLNDRWQIGSFSGADSPRTALSNTTVGDLSNSDTIGAAGDNAAAFQYQLSLAARGNIGGRVTKGYNFIPVPTPSSLALLGLGGLAMARRRR